MSYVRCKECGKSYDPSVFGSYNSEYCCKACYEKARERKESFNCPVCGQLVTRGGYSAGDPNLKGMKKMLSSKKFCSLTCAENYWATHESLFTKRAAEKEAKRINSEAKKEEVKVKKESKKEIALENSKVTSEKSFKEVSKLCVVAGLFGAHRFFVGKFKSGICMLFFGSSGILMGEER